MRKRTKEKNKSQMFRLFGIFILVQIFLSIPVYGENNQEEKTEDRSVEDLYNLEEEDKNGFYIGAGTVKKSYLPFEKIQLVLEIQNTGYPEVRDVEAELLVPSGFTLKAKEKESTRRKSLGLGEVMTVEYEGYHTIAIVLFLGVGAGVFVLLVFFFLLFRFIRNRKRRKQLMTGIVLMTLLAQSQVAFAAEFSQYAIAESIAEGINLETSVWEESEIFLSQKVPVGLAKPEMQYQISFKQDTRLNVQIAHTDGDEIRLEWNEIEGLETFEIYKRTGNEKYEFVDSTEKMEYVCEGISEGTPVTYQIVGYDSDRETAICSNECRYITQDGEEFIDSDGDNLQDFLEEQFGTSLELADTDGDGLLDSTEIYQTFTDPLKADTNGDGIYDGMEDMDRDNLTNLREQEIGTSPMNGDTDGEGLLDWEEWPSSEEEPLSDPLSADTDQDGLNDKLEREFGTDPWNPDSNGDGVSDLEDTYTREYKMAGSDSVIHVKAPGEALVRAEILDYTYTSVLSEKDYVVSEVTCMNMEDTFEEASVTMKIKEDKVPEGDYENVSMFYYNEERNGFEEMPDQSYDAETGTITAPTTHFSTFVLVYVPNWHAQFESAVSPERSEDGDVTYADVSFVIDESSSMEDSSKGEANDPNRYRVQAAKNFVDALIQGDRAAVIGFSDSASRKCELTENMDEVRGQIDSISGNNGGTAMHTGLKEALDELVKKKDAARTQFIILLSDGEDSSPAEEEYEKLTETAIQYGIAIYAIALGENSDVSTLSQLSLNTGGDFFRLDKAEDLPQVYSRIANNAVMGPDTDKDGLADKVEKYGIRDGMGTIYFTDANEADTDQDEMEDGEEVGGIYKQDEDGTEYYIILTDPTEADTDGDGLTDLEETEAGTLPWCRDTDGDSLEDGLEWKNGFNPLNGNKDGDAFGDYAEYYDSAKSFADFVNMDAMDQEDWLYKFCNLVRKMLDRDPYTYDLCDEEIVFSILSAILIGDFGTNLVEIGVLDANYVNSVYYLAGNIIGGLIPVWDKITSVRDLIADFINGDWTGVTLNAIGAIPAFGEASEVAADMTNAISKTLDDLPNLQRIVLWLSDSFRSSAKFFYTQDMFIEAGKRMIKDGFCNLVTRKGLQKAQLVEDFMKYTEETEILFTRRLMGVSENAVHFSGELSGSPQELASTARKALDNQLGGKVTEEIVEGTSQKVYKKVSVLDLDADTYKNSSAIKSTLNKRVQRVKEFGGSNQLDMTGVKVKQLDVVVPNTLMTDEMSQALLEAQQEALESGVQINYKVYTADGLGGTFFDDMQKANLKKKVNVSGDSDTGSKKKKEKNAKKLSSSERIELHKKRIEKSNIKKEMPGKDLRDIDEKIQDLAEKSINKPANVKGEPEEVMLGKHLTKHDKYGNEIYDETGKVLLEDNSYQKLAQDRGCLYYEMPQDEWTKLKEAYGEGYTRTINLEFLNEMIDREKTFIFSADPFLTKGSDYYMEYKYITELIKAGEKIKIVELWK